MAAPQPMPASLTHVRMAGGLVATLVPPVAAAALRLLDRLPLDQQPAVGWIVVAGCILAALSQAVATAALLTGSTRTRGAVGAAAAAGGTGALAVGLSLAAITASGDPAGFPGPGLALAVAAAGGLFVIGLLVPNPADGGRRARLLAGVAVFELLELLLVADLLAGDALRPDTTSLAVGGATATLLAAVAGSALPPLRDRSVAGLLPVAGALVALALARPATVDLLPGVLGLAVAGGLVAVGAPRGEEPAEQPAPRLGMTPVPLLTTIDDTVDSLTNAPFDTAATDERLRLAHELRGTIEELLQARQIIALQRAEIERAATTDALTGLPARGSILTRLAQEVTEARRYSHPVAVALLDVDGFGALNATYGLGAGDRVLRELALRLRMRIRAADALGRAGADSFLAILPHADEQGAAEFTRALLRRLTGKPMATDAGEISVTISAGVALMLPGMDLSDERLLNAAEEALAAAQAAGGNRIAFDRLHGLPRIADRREGG